MSLEKFSGIGGSMKRQPEAVKEARLSGDREALSKMGASGARVTNEIKDEKRFRNEIFGRREEEKKIEEELARKKSTNEDILSPDGEDPHEAD